MGQRQEKESHIKMSTSQLACTYAALILHDDDMQISADNIKALVTAAGVDIETYWPPMFAKALEGKDINELLTTVSGGGGGAAGPAAAAGAAGGAEEAKEEEKKESSSSDEDMGGAGMFDEDY